MISMNIVSSRMLWQTSKAFQTRSGSAILRNVQTKSNLAFLPSILSFKRMVYYPAKSHCDDDILICQLGTAFQRKKNRYRLYATSIEKGKNEQEKKIFDDDIMSEINVSNLKVPTFDNIKFVEDDTSILETSEFEEEGTTIDRAEVKSSRKKTKKRIKAIRQHVNPLSAYYQLPIELNKDWIQKAYKDPTLPFHIDIGCARGQFCIGMALLNRNVNYLGLEIRRPCVNEANLKLYEKRSTDVTNVHFLASNANIDLETIVHDIQKIAKSYVETISIQFPDPHFKKKHHKRRVVQPELVETIGKTLAYTKPGSKENNNKLFIQSDVLEVIEEMRYSFRNSTILKDTVPNFEEWLPSNPMDVLTEREKLVLRQNLPVYRTTFQVNTSNGTH